MKLSSIIYKKDRWVIHQVTSSDNGWQRMTASDNECQWVVRVTKSGTTRGNEWETTSDYEWRVITNDNKWQQMTTSGHFG